MNPIKVGLIGFGRMGGFYLEEMQKSGKWDIVYICDVSHVYLELAQRLSPRSKVISDEQIIFNDPEIQAVGLFALYEEKSTIKHIVSNTTFHCSISTASNYFRASVG